MTSIVQYKHEDVGTSIAEFPGPPKIQTVFPGRMIYPKGAAVILEHDPDKKYRQFTLSALMTGEEYYDFHALIFATTVYGVYPRLEHVKLEGDGTHDWANIKVMPLSAEATVYNNKKVIVTFVCLERS